VLYQASLRDLFMYLIANDAFQGKWSTEIHDEWTKHLIANGKEKSKVLRTKSLMDNNFPEAIVKNYRPLIKKLSLPDLNDRRVLAAAIKSGAKYIITENLKDFPKKYLPENLKGISPDDFLIHLSEKKVQEVLSGVKAHRASLKNPPYSAKEYIQARKIQGLNGFAMFLNVHFFSI
jgi:predicted nucleic acid-binding protein